MIILRGVIVHIINVMGSRIIYPLGLSLMEYSGTILWAGMWDLIKRKGKLGTCVHLFLLPDCGWRVSSVSSSRSPDSLWQTVCLNLEPKRNPSFHRLLIYFWYFLIGTRRAINTRGRSTAGWKRVPCNAKKRKMGVGGRGWIWRPVGDRRVESVTPFSGFSPKTRLGWRHGII